MAMSGIVIENPGNLLDVEQARVVTGQTHEVHLQSRKQNMRII